MAQKQIKILHITDYATKKMAQNLAENLQQKGVLSTLICLPELFKNKFFATVLRAHALRKTLRKKKISLIHLHSTHHLAATFLATLGLRRIKIICTFNTNTPSLSWWQKLALKRLNSAIVPSNAANLAFLPTKVHTATTALSIDAPAFIKKAHPNQTDAFWEEWAIPSVTKVIYIPINTTDNETLFAFLPILKEASRLTQREVRTAPFSTPEFTLAELSSPAQQLKNFYPNIQNLNQHPTFKLIIAGGFAKGASNTPAKSTPNTLKNSRPKTFTDLWQAVEKAGLTKDTLFINTPKNEASAYSAADLILLTEANNFYAQTALKAQAVGKPIIAPKVLNFLFKEGQTGWGFDPKNLHKTSPIKKALQNQEALYRMGKACTSYVKNTHSATNTLNKTLELYEKTLSMPAKKPTTPPLLTTLVLSLMLTACAENFSWQNPKTWHFKLSEEERNNRKLHQACAHAQAQGAQRVILMNGIADRVEHTECPPYTQRPLTPQRFEGR